MNLAFGFVFKTVRNINDAYVEKAITQKIPAFQELALTAGWSGFKSEVFNNVLALNILNHNKIFIAAVQSPYRKKQGKKLFSQPAYG